jgi:hypothetical protein
MKNLTTNQHEQQQDWIGKLVSVREVRGKNSLLIDAEYKL